jgi:hypothetical protein
MSVVYELFRN